METMMAEMNQQMLLISPGVQLWMNWMMICLGLSVLFAYKYNSARYIMGGFLLTIPAAMVIFYLFGSVHLFGIPHLLIWTPLVWFVYRADIKTNRIKAKSVYGVWLRLAVLTMSISLVFDFRDVVLIILGAN
jgi:hypothetical protein